LLSLALVLGLEMSPRTKFESLAVALALRVKSLCRYKSTRIDSGATAGRLSIQYINTPTADTETLCPPSFRWGASTSYVDCSVDCCARLRYRLQSRGCSLRVDYCWDSTGHGCPTLCLKLWCFWSATVLHWGMCSLDLTQVSCWFSRAPQSHTNYDAKAVKAPCDCQLERLSLWHCLIKCLLRELVPPLSYFFLVLCSLAPRNIKRSLNVFWRLVLGLEAQVLVNNTGILRLKYPKRDLGYNGLCY